MDVHVASLSLGIATFFVAQFGILISLSCNVGRRSADCDRLKDDVKGALTKIGDHETRISRMEGRK